MISEEVLKQFKVVLRVVRRILQIWGLVFAERLRSADKILFVMIIVPYEEGLHTVEPRGDTVSAIFVTIETVCLD